MNLDKHLIASGVVSAGIFASTGSLKIAAASFVTGVFMDLDHVIDYWCEYPFSLNVRRFFEVYDRVSLEKTRLFLHSAELLVAAAAAAYFTRSGLIAGLVLGVSQHLALDQFFNEVYPAGYFFVYRLSTGFKAQKIFRNTRRGNSDGNYQKTSGS